MAENDNDRSTEDLSDEASPYRLEKNRTEGKVAQSRELTGIFAFFIMASSIFLFSDKIGHTLFEYFVSVFKMDIAQQLKIPTDEFIKQKLYKFLYILTAAGLPIVLVGFFMNILGAYAQVGSVFSTKPLEPDFSKINPLTGIQRFFSLKQFYDGLRIIFKTIIVTTIAYFLVKSQILSSSRFILMDPSGLLGGLNNVSKLLFFSLIVVLFVFAGLDFWLQKWEYSKSVRLTKQEAKEEHKEHEGDPLIRARIRSIQREMAKKRMMEAVKTADVIITNPTHVAVALKYDRSNMSSPKVVAKGIDFMAQKIKKLAADNGVPLVENVPLARTLYKSVKIGQAIPRALFQAVAEVLAYVYKLKNKRFE